MNLKKFTSSLLLTCFFHQAVSTAAFAVIDDFEGVERYAQGLTADHHTSLHFKADPAHTAAGVLFYMLDPDGDYSVILGQRDDDPGFCSFFGKSDANDGTLNVTAARESAEESMGLFAVHDYLVLRAPFADVYSAGVSGDKSELRRMYVCQAEYIDEARFDKKLSEETDSHSKEYRRFKTFKVRDLLGSVTSGNTLTRTADGEEVQLYEPLHNMLSTPFYRDVLDRLANKKRTLLSVPQKASYVREEDYTRHGDGKASAWAELAHEFEAIARESAERAIANATEAREELKLIKKLKKFGHNLDGMKIVPNTYETVQFTAQEEKEFAYTEAFRQRVMMELKSKAEKQQATMQALSAVEPLAERGRYTMTEGHLMLVLGSDYVEPADFTDPIQHRQANIANLKKYFAVHKDMEYENKMAKEGDPSRELMITNHLIERLADVMDLERQEWIKTGRFPMYHGAEDKNGHAFKVASSLHNALTLNAADRLTRLRYTDLYFRDTPDTMDEDMAQFTAHHYDNGNPDRRLFANFTLTAMKTTSRSTSSSVEYWVNNHSVKDAKVQKRFEEGTALLGMDLSSDVYTSLFYQFINGMGGERENAILLQLFLTPAALTRYCTTEYIADCYIDEKVPLNAYLAMQAEYERVAAAREDFSVATEQKKGRFGEVRLLIHPDAMRDSAQLTVRGLDLFPLDEQKQRRFNDKMSEVTAANLGYWFAQKTALIPGGLMEAPTARNLYKMVHKGVTGNDVEDVPNTHSLPHLARFGHIDAMKKLIETCPDLVESINPVDLFRAALSCGSKEKDANGILVNNGYAVIKYVVEEIVRKPINEVFSENALLVYISTNDVRGSAFKYILEMYDFNDVSMAAKEKIADSMLRSGDVDALKNVHTRIRPYTDEDVAEKLIVPYYDDMRTLETLETLIRADILTVESAATITLRCFEKTLKEKQDDLTKFLKFFFKNGLNCATINPMTGNPILFNFPYLQAFSEDDFDYLKRNLNFLNIRNAKGLTLLDHMFTEYRKGRSPYGHYFVQPCDNFIRDQGISLESLISPDLYIFFKLQRGSIHGLIENSHDINPFKGEEAQNWVRQMESALESDNYFEIEKTLAESPVGLYEYYKIERPYDIAMTKHWQLVKERDNWFGSLYEARSKGLLFNETLNTIPLFCDVPEYYAELAPSFYQEFQTRVPVRAEQRKQIRETWEAQLASALQSQSYMGLKQAMTNLPDPDLEITDFGAEIKQKVRIQSEEKRQRKVRHNVLRDQLEKEFRNSPETFLSHVFDIDDIDFSLFSCNFFSSIFRDEYAPHAQRFLNLIFKDVAIEKRAKAVLKPIGKNGSFESYEPFIVSVIRSSQQKTIIEILKWAGCADVLKQMTQNQLANVLYREYEKEDSYWIFNEAFDVFGIREPGRDFLQTAFSCFSKDKVKKLAHHHIAILGELDETGWPLFYGLLRHEDLVMELIVENPALLNFETSTGLTLEKLASGLSDEDDDYTITQRLLKIKQGMQK